MTTERKNLIIWGSFLILTLAWGSSFILVKRAMENQAFSPYDVASLRMLAAFICLAVPAFLNLKHIPKDKLFYVVLSGWLSMFVPAFLFCKGQELIGTSSLISILNALTPAFTFLIGIYLFKQPILMRQVVGLLVGFLGSLLLIMVNTNGEIALNYYAFLILAATFCYGMNVNLIKFKLSEIKSIHLSTVAVGVAGLSAIVYLILSNSVSHVVEAAQAHPLQFSYIMLLGMMSTALAQVVFNYMLTLTTSVFASAITYFIPIVAVLWGVLDGEILGLWHYVGMLFIIGGIVILNRAK